MEDTVELLNGGKSTSDSDSDDDHQSFVSLDVESIDLRSDIGRSEDETHEVSRCARILFLVTIIVMFATLTIMVVNGKSTVDYDPIWEIESIYVSPFNISSSRIYTTWNITFSIGNPLFFATYLYENLLVSILYKEELLLVTQAMPFSLDGKMRTSFQARLSASPTVVEDVVADELFVLKTSLQPAAFNVTVHGKVNSNYYGLGKCDMIVSCYDVKIGFPQGIGTMVMVPFRCKFEADKWHIWHIR